MKAQIVSFHCVLKNQLGQVLSTSFNQDVLASSEIHGLPLGGLSKELQSIQKGERREIFVPAAQAYGFYDLEKVKQVSLEQIAEDLRVGETIRMEKDPCVYRVIEIIGDSATLDANHPLAGQDLIFEVEATHVRLATADELRGVNETSKNILFH